MLRRAVIGFVVLTFVAAVPATLLAGPEEGKKIYEAKCINCHGSSGKGDGPGSGQVEKVFKKKVGDFTATDLSKLAKPDRTAKEDALRKLIADAKPPMSAFTKTLSPEDQANVLEYVTRTFMNGAK